MSGTKVMHHFHYKDEDLYCEEVPVAEIADRLGLSRFLCLGNGISSRAKLPASVPAQRASE